MTLGVFRSGDFLRIRDLPRRPPTIPDDAAALLTAHLKTPQGTETLRPDQAFALIEAYNVGGLVGMLSAGAGKFHVSALLFTLLESQRGLLCVPAKLREQTYDVWAEKSFHWQFRPLFGVDATPCGGPQVRLLSYESLSTVRFAAFLDEYQPDLIVCDEGHALAHLKAARSKRMFRYIKGARKRGIDSPVRTRLKPGFIPLSGTMWRKSIREASHLFEAALGDQAPVPLEYPDLEQWSFALDEGVRDENRIAPGALLEFCTPEEAKEGLDGVRKAYRRRLVEAPGVVASASSSVDLSLIIQVREVPVPAAVAAALARLRATGDLPSGDRCSSGLDLWAHLRELGTGFTNYWSPPAPPEWLEAKKKWIDFVRNVTDSKVDGKPLDSPLQVWNAVEAGKFGTVPEWQRWKDIRGTFEPNPKPFWVDDFLVRDAEEWALKTGGIVWVGHASPYTQQDEDDDLGRGFTKIPYFGGADERVRTYKGPCAASIRSHGTGKNLTQWSRALILCCPSSGATMEQLLARHHRTGQKADEVVVDINIHTVDMLEAFKTCIREARYKQDISGEPQRILGATLLSPDGHAWSESQYADRLSSDDPVWSRAK